MLCSCDGIAEFLSNPIRFTTAPIQDKRSSTELVLHASLHVHVFYVHRGAASHIYPPRSIPPHVSPTLSVVHISDWTNFSFDQLGPIGTVYDRHMLEKLVFNQVWWIDMCNSAPVHVKNVKEKKSVGQVPWKTACVGSRLPIK